MDKINEIIISDKFLTDDEMTNANGIISKSLWRYGHTSEGKYLYETKFWSMDLTKDNFFSVYLLSVIEKHFSKKFELLRVYANGHTFGQDGEFHTDSDKDKYYTFCLYFTKINDEYVETAGGYIYFKLPDLNYKICYEPLYNRGILFPSNYIHKGTAYTRYIMDMRVCVAWKLRLIE
jgi:hypothetical protein